MGNGIHMAEETDRNGRTMDTDSMETQMDGLTPVTVGQIRRAQEEMADSPSTLVLGKGRMIGKRALRDLKKKPVFLSVPAGRTVAITKHSWVEVFDKEGHACRFYAEKKGAITGPCLMRTGPMSPGEVPSPLQGVGDELRLMGAAVWLFPVLGVLSLLGLTADRLDSLWLLGLVSNIVLGSACLTFALYWILTYCLSGRVVCPLRPHTGFAVADRGEGVAPGSEAVVVARPGEAQDADGSSEGELGRDAPKAE